MSHICLLFSSRINLSSPLPNEDYKPALNRIFHYEHVIFG